jgi:hypothetical protein
MALFSGAKAQSAVGEKSVMYLYSKTCPTLIERLFPNSKFICVLRNPIDVMWSLFKYNLMNIEEDRTDFAEALSEETNRRKGMHVPRGGTLSENLNYRDITAFSGQVEHWLAQIGEGRLHIVLFDDLASQPDQMFRGVEDFLGIPHDPSVDLKPRNEGVSVYATRLRRLRYLNPVVSYAWAKLVAPSMQERAKALFKSVADRNGSVIDVMPAELRAELRREYAPQIDRLARVVDRDLSHWNRL